MHWQLRIQGPSGPSIFVTNFSPRCFSQLELPSSPVHTGWGAPCNWCMQWMEHTVINGNVHTAHKQHQICKSACLSCVNGALGVRLLLSVPPLSPLLLWFGQSLGSPAHAGRRNVTSCDAFGMKLAFWISPDKRPGSAPDTSIFPALRSDCNLDNALSNAVYQPSPSQVPFVIYLCFL